MNLLDLMTPIIYQNKEGMIVGRTRQEKPRYDLRLADGTIIPDLPPDVFEVK